MKKSLYTLLLISIVPFGLSAQNSILNPVGEAVKKATEVVEETGVNPASTKEKTPPLKKAKPATEAAKDAVSTIRGQVQGQVPDAPPTVSPARVMQSVPSTGRSAVEQVQKGVEKPTSVAPVNVAPVTQPVTKGVEKAKGDPTNRVREMIPTRSISREELQKRMSELRSRVKSPTDLSKPAVPAPKKRVPAKQLNSEARRMVEGTPAPDQKTIEKKAKEITTTQDAQSLVNTILGVPSTPAKGNRPAPTIQRLDAAETGRTQSERQETVTSIVNQFLGTTSAVPNSVALQSKASPPAGPKFHLYEGNRRVVRYKNRDAIPPILLATGRLNRVDVRTVARADYLGNRPDWVQEVPATYRNPNAYAVSYQVDPQSVVTRDDILFRQGSTAFADAYSFDIVADLAEAMLTSQLRNHEFVIEGHASAEGSYELNLDLSQRRAERIARDLVGYGVDPNRLIPVGYGETEARYPADAREDLRSLDRRVMVFRLE